MRNKKGISLITLVVTIVVMIILASIVILSFNNSNIIKDAKETKYKNELKSYAEEVASKITNEYMKDKTVIYRDITEPDEIKKYSENLVKSEYIDYAYISGGELTLRGKLLTDEQRTWAEEANIKIDDEEAVFIEEKVKITLSENDWTYGPISANLSFSAIPNGYEMEYKINDGKWTVGEILSDIKRNGIIYARLYNKNTYNEIALNSKNITNIDREKPTITQVIEPELWGKDSVNVVVVGAKDSASGLADKAYSFDDGATWQESNSKSFTSNLSGIIIKVRDKVGNEYVHPAINITKIDKTAPSITSVTGNPTEWTKEDVTLTVNGAKDDESALAEMAYSFDGGTTWQAQNKKTFTINTSNIIIKVRDAVGNIYTHSAINITKIDKDAPSIPTAIDTIPELNKITVKASGSTDSGSGILGYKYSLDNNTWTDIILIGKSHEFTNIKAATSKTIYAKAVDNVGNESQVYGPINTSTTTVTNKVEISLSTEVPTQGPIKATLSYENAPNGYEIQYKVGTGNWTTGTITPDISSNITVYGRLYNTTLDDGIAINEKNITNIDKTAPSITSVTGNPESWTKDDVTLVINGVSDNSNVLAELPYSFDGGTSWQAENKKTYTENTSNIIIKVKDFAGNIYTHSTMNITKIDKDAPEITSVTGNPTEWTKNDVTLTINGALDGASGLHKTETYSFDNGSTWQISNQKTYTANESNIIIKVKDVVGNVYTHTPINIEKIDKTAPSKPTAIAVTPSLNSISVKASGSTDDGSKLAGYKYRLGETGTWSATIAAGTAHTFNDIKSNTTVKVYAKAVDNLGFESSVFGPVDATTSTVTNKVAITLSTEAWTKGPITATLSYDSVPTGYVIQYKIGTGNWTDGTKTTDISSNITVCGRLYNKTLDDEIATNSKDITIIDNDPPTDPTDIAVITREQTSITVKASGSKDTGSGLAGYQYSLDTTSWSDTIANGVSYEIKNLNVNTTYKVYARAIDKLDNISEDNYSISTSTLSTYSVSYNSNTTDSVSNMPTNQTKIENTTLTLSATIPTRTGYTFSGWATSTSGNVEYVAGAKYTTNSSVTLYAIWTPITYTVVYNANGGSGTMADSTHTYGVAKTLTANAFTKTGYSFEGWATTSTGSVVYSDEQSVTNLSNTDGAKVNLYAVWRLLNVAPTMQTTSLISRSTNNFVVQAKATDSDGDNLTYKLYVKKSSASSYTLASTSASTASGTAVSLTASNLDTYTIYDYYVTVTDGKAEANGTISTTGTACAGPFTTSCNGNSFLVHSHSGLVYVEYCAIHGYRISQYNIECYSCKQEFSKRVCDTCDNQKLYMAAMRANSVTITYPHNLPITCTHGYTSTHYPN